MLDALDHIRTSIDLLSNDSTPSFNEVQDKVENTFVTRSSGKN
jgi:hypothetical protein